MHFSRPSSRFLLAATAMLSATAALAGDFVWTGNAGDGQWSTAGNWRDGAAPAAATDVVLFSSDADINTTFDLSVSPVIKKAGSGKLTVSGGSAYNNTVSTGSLFLYGGSIDLGGGKASMKQTADGDAVLADGTALYNATVAYSSAYNPGPCVGLKLPEGTVTFGAGATITDNSSYILSYGTPSGGATGTRAVILDGATYNVKAGIYVCGANTTSSTINDGTSFPTMLVLSNNATLNVTDGNKTVRVGASFNGNHSPVNGAGILRVVDSTVIMNGGQMHLNDVDTSKTGNQNCYGLISFEDSTLTFNGNYNRPNLLTSNRDSNQAAHSYAEIVLKNTTATLWSINAMSLGYTGSLTTLLPDGYTAILRLDGTTLIPRGARTDFIYNSKLATRPCVKLEGNNSVINTEYDVTIPAVAFGTAGWTKKGVGTLTLAGANLYTGATRVEAGALVLTGSLAGGIEAIGGSFTTDTGGTYPSLLMNGGAATFNTAATFSSLAIGANGGTLSLGAKGFTFNNVTGTANLSGLTLSVAPASWGTGEVLYSDSADFLAWAAAAIDDLLPNGYSASVGNGAVVISASIALKTTTWTGGGADALWSTDANWDEGAPNSGDTVILDGTAQTTNTLGSALSVPTLTFPATAGAFAIGGGGALSIVSGFTNLSDNAQTINVPVTLTAAPASLYAVGDIAFGSTLGGTRIVKTGAGTATLSSSYTGALDIEEGGIALADDTVSLTETADALVVAGTLDLGGGSLALSQSDNGDPILRDGAVLKNGTFSYSCLKTVWNSNNQNGTAIIWPGGTITVGEDATFSPAGQLFAYGPDTPAETTGERRILVDGGTLSLSRGNSYIIGVNRDWTKGATVELANGGRLESQQTENSSSLMIGARNSGSGTSYAAKGLLVANDSEIDLAHPIYLLNPNGAGHYGRIALTNSTMTIRHSSTGLRVSYYGGDAYTAGSDIGVDLNNSTLSTVEIALKAISGTGVAAGKTVGGLTLDNGTLQARANKSPWIENRAATTTTPAIELLTGGGVFDTQSYSVAVPAVIYGAGVLTKIGSGTLTLSGANTYTGATIVSNGTLVVADGAAIAGPVVVADGGTLSVADNATVFSSFTLKAGGRVAVPAFEGAYVALFNVAGDIILEDVMQSGGNCLFVKRNGDGTGTIRYGHTTGMTIMLR